MIKISGQDPFSFDADPHWKKMDPDPDPDPNPNPDPGYFFKFTEFF